MKKNLLPLLIIFIFQLSFAQKNYTLLNKSGWCCEQFAGTGAIYTEFYVSGDTIINDEYFVEINNMFYLTEDTVLKKVWYLYNKSYCFFF